MIAGHVPAIRLSPDHACGLLAAAVLVCGLRGDTDRVRQWRGHAGELAADGTRRSTDLFAAFTESRVALHHGHYDQGPPPSPGSASANGPGMTTPGTGKYDAYAWALAAEAAVIADLPGASRLLAAAAPAAQENLWAAACLARAHGRVHGDRAALEESLAGWQHIG